MAYTVKIINNHPIPVRNIYCVCRNYREHAKELGNPVPTQPVFFQKALTSLSTGEEIILPVDREIQHELEIVVLISKDGYQISKNQTEDYIEGFALGLDLTDRPLQTKLKARQYPWFLSKSFKGAAVVTEFDEPDPVKWSRPFWLKNNNTTVQKGEMSEMVFDIPSLIVFISRYIPLLAGDLIYTGTPQGVGLLRKGDILELGLGDQTLKRLICK